MSDADVQAAYHHVTEFYKGNSAPEIQKWLSDFSSSVQAWTICDRILGERRDSLSCCFAAQTLRQKILKSLREIPADSYLSLRTSLIDHLSHIHPTPGDNLGESTLTQLCLAIADLYIQVPEWNNWIVPFLSQCAGLQGDRTKMMLTLLRVFPEEVKTIRVGENRRRAIRDELASGGTDVLNYLGHVLETMQSDEEIVKRVMNCMAAYLDNPALCTDELAKGPLLSAAFLLMSMANISPSLHDAASECVVAAIIMAENQSAHLALAKSVQRQVYNLCEHYNAAVARDDLYQLQNFARVFTELNETLIEKIVNEPSGERTELGCLYSLELLLMLAGHHDYTMIEKTFNVWYRLSELLFVIDDDAHLDRYKPYVNRYLAALYRHARFDTDEEDLPDESAEFMGFRMKVSETVKDVVFVIGTNECVNMMYHMLKSCTSPNNTWDEMEAALFIMAAVVHNIVPEEDNVIPDVVDSISALPANSHPALTITSIDLLGGCDEWLEKHTQYHDKVLHWLLSLLANPRFSKYSADSIEKIILKSSRTLKHVFPHLMGHIAVLEKSQVRGKEIELAISCLLRAATALIMHLPDLEVRTTITQMCEPIVHRLNHVLAHDGAQTMNNGNKENVAAADSWEFIARDPIIWIDRVSAIFQKVRPWQCKLDLSTQPIPAPWIEVASALFTVLSNTLERYQSRQRVVEHVCRSLRYLVRSLGPQSCGFLEPIIKKMMEIYPKYPHSCILYLASILVDEYGAIEITRPGLMLMLESLSTATFGYLTRGDVQITMRDNPDTVDDLFRLAARFIQRAPSSFFLHPISTEIFKCGLTALPLDHQEANRSVTRFFLEILNQMISAKKRRYSDDSVVKAEHLLISNGEALVTATLNAALFSVSGNLRRDMAEIIFLIGRLDSTKQKEWLMAATVQLPRGGLAATDAQLAQFVSNVTDNPLCSGTREVYSEIRDLMMLYH